MPQQKPPDAHRDDERTRLAQALTIGQRQAVEHIRDAVGMAEHRAWVAVEVDALRELLDALAAAPAPRETPETDERPTFQGECPFCEEVISAGTAEAFDAAKLAHLTAEFEAYFEGEVKAGRAERVVRDGKTLYRMRDDTLASPPRED